MIDSRINTNRSWLANRLRHYPLTVCCLLLFAAPAIAQDQSLAPAGFTAEQAAQGEREYNNNAQFATVIAWKVSNWHPASAETFLAGAGATNR